MQRSLLIFFALSFTAYADNPIRVELEKLDIEAILERQQQRSQIEIDLYYKKQKDKQTIYQYQSKSNKPQWNKTENALSNIEKSIENKLQFKGSLGEIKVKPGLKQKINVKYKYAF
ncbi:hypothetical protein [Candidatus Thiodubiliella endoseptemdiera]|uniref:Uncharacterized protein n=1 Tax=Candidatus Thiodubiliella endoseptemdiera TaxID=2738886 RepID=A0A853F2Z3_9GAMM|nr:hypothetical protein [Candidatus Thiodubiliella endoseptemdiera]